MAFQAGARAEGNDRGLVLRGDLYRLDDIIGRAREDDGIRRFGMVIALITAVAFQHGGRGRDLIAEGFRQFADQTARLGFGDPRRY